ncbi:MAG: HAD-IIA family hydrolase [Chloroflexota bacterium]|nr:HAD-IIA family hydrolase [Chloroflexota bacterium]
MAGRSSRIATRRAFLLAGAVGFVLSLLLALTAFVAVRALPGLALLSEAYLGTSLPAFIFLLALGSLAVLELPLVLIILVRLARRGATRWTLNGLHFAYVAFPGFYGVLGTFLTGERWWLWLMLLLSGARYASSAAAIHPSQMAARHAMQRQDQIPRSRHVTSEGTVVSMQDGEASDQLLNRVKGFILDMDGVLYRGLTVREGAIDFVAYLNKHDIPYVCLTNNASRTSEMYQEKLDNLGIPIDSAHVLGAAQATAEWLAEQSSDEARVLPVGEEGLHEELSRAGFTLVDQAPADYVVVGIDFHFSYDKLKRAALAIRSGAEFIGTNPDPTFPSEEGLLPGNGAILAYLEAATGVEPTIIGKPSRPMMEVALEHVDLPPENVAIVGDRLNTDIQGGQTIGLITILVRGGVTSDEELVHSDIKPDLVIDHLGALLEDYRQERNNSGSEEG